MPADATASAAGTVRPTYTPSGVAWFYKSSALTFAGNELKRVTVNCLAGKEPVSCAADSGKSSVVVQSVGPDVFSGTGAACYCDFRNIAGTSVSGGTYTCQAYCW